MPWLPVMLRGTRVLARCDESGAFAAEDGRVEIRYRANDGKAYRAMVANLGKIAGAAVLPDAHCGDAAPVAKAPAEGGGAAARATGATKSSRKESAKVAAETRVAPSDAILAYTDGACSGNPGPAGLGVVLLQDGARSELSEYLGTGTNNIAELTAILRALERVGTSDRTFWVHTDSQYAIGVLTKGWKAKVNQELIAATKVAIKGFPRFQLIYVPGHAGVPLNERADELARAGVSARGTSGWKELR